MLPYEFHEVIHAVGTTIDAIYTRFDFEFIGFGTSMKLVDEIYGVVFLVI